MRAGSWLWISSGLRLEKLVLANAFGLRKTAMIDGPLWDLRLEMQKFVIRRFNWLRGLDLNQRPLGYERPGARVSY